MATQPLRFLFTRLRVLLTILLSISLAWIVTATAQAEVDKESFVTFESGQVRPLAKSEDGKYVYAVNTPDNRLEIFRVTRHGLKNIGSILVGLEPVAVAVRGNEAWVVNHLSDSISIVEVGSDPLRVKRTLLVGDEPRDIVFAGEDGKYAFITTAHRGQNVPFDPQLTTPGVGRADVWVFDAEKIAESESDEPVNIINLFTDTPRALSTSPDGSKVYAAGFHTGNRTTALNEQVVANNGGLPAPTTNFEGIEQPSVGLIVQFDGSAWLDEAQRDWSQQVKFSLPDQDVFVIDASSSPPRLSEGNNSFSGVGTVLFNMAVHPVSGDLYVSNLEARNVHRFEGPGEFANQTLRGHISENRISIVNPSGEVLPRHLNKHIDYSSCCDAIPNEENRTSLAFPMGMEFSADGKLLYVTGFGSNKIGVYSVSELKDDSFQPNVKDQILLSGGGPSGLVLDESRHRLYVLTRFNNAITVIDTRQRSEKQVLAMHNPEPASVVNGRRFLYDASYTSSHGDTACASCHIFADLDSLAWDLGDPDAMEINNPGPFTLTPQEVDSDVSVHFRPLKGPMTTQSLRGLANHGPMHWRGDRTGGNDAPSIQPDGGSFDEDAAFKKFNVAFEGLNGRHEQLSEAEMQAFTDFILQVTYPPNPIRNLDNSLTALQQAGKDVYFGDRSDTVFNCNGCHVLDAQANAEFGVYRPGFFGTDGQYTFENEPQVFKVPHLRNLYQKVGMFGMDNTEFFIPESATEPNQFTGPQIRGFGFLHDGSVDTVSRFLSATVFVHRPPGFLDPQDPGNPDGFTLDLDGFIKRGQVEQFLLAFDSNLAPIVGQQITLSAANTAKVSERIELLKSRAEAGECDLVVQRRSWDTYLYVGQDKYQSAFARPPISEIALTKLAQQPGNELTYTCVPPGSGKRIGLDRDGDGFYDRDERKAGSDPASAESTPD